ncbi:MAG: BamA/TamA family outer membrane protein [Coleofasciculus sp. Co-bin14]|nr:BamA/TamA family outer membrane protein [Coleofasciculus sp. Co-bin14]
MLKKAIAISTLAVLAAGELTHQAIASPDLATSTSKPTANNYVIPVGASPAPQSTGAIASPQVVVTPESAQTAQKPVSASTSLAQSSQPSTRSTNTNNVVVPTTTPSPQPARTPAQSTITNDLAVTATDVQVTGATEELKQIVLNTIRTRPGGTTSQSQLNDDVAAILNTGFFADARVTSSKNPNGVNVAFQVEPIVVRSIQASGNQVLPAAIVNDAFRSQIGQPISVTSLRQAAEQVSKWYKDNGYTLAQVVAARPDRNGTVTIDVAEGIVGDINIRFLDKEGKPTQGRTKEDFIKRELKLKPGQVFRGDVAQQDLQQLYKLGLFQNANIALNGDSRKVDLTYELIEAPARSVNAGGGYSADSGLFGTVSYKDVNLGGSNQQVGLNLQVGTRDFLFDGNYTNPYRESDPNKPGYSVDVFRRRSLSQTFNNDIGLANGDQPREGQIGAGVTLTKPVGEWDGSVGVNYTRTSIRDSNGNITPTDKLGNPLSLSGTGVDDLFALTAGISRDQRNNPINPTQGSILSLSTSQSIPIGNGSILMNQVKANYSEYTPVRLLGTKEPEVFAFNVQGGTTIGDLPPYMAFNLGGINSVRGYGTGDVASGRSYVLASAEYRIPIYKPIGAVLFADFGSDLGTGNSVPGEPGVVRGKPGTGFGYGAGLRVNSPIGIIRADYGFNDQGGSQLQFGLGQRF